MSSWHHSDVRIGTSGYSYSWNKSKPYAFEWYLNQGFNSIEINGSFYRFPTDSSVKNWKKRAPSDFTFSIKVHRSITHYNRLKQPRSIELWTRFEGIFESFKDKIDFWLFQMPANFKFKQENVERIGSFFESVKKYTADKAVIEFREPSWWEKGAMKEIEKIGIAFCSVNAPDLPKEIIAINNVIYLRLHGSKTWYNYLYTEQELTKIVSDIKAVEARKKAVYLNNDHGMLKNGLYLMKQLCT